MRKRRTALRWFALAALGLVMAGAATRAADHAALASAVASITRDELKGHVDVLADDTFEGREAGSRGGRAAGNYLLKEYERLGLKPAGDGGSYVQSFGAASRNVLGLIEGSDPQLKEQVVLLGAHYDHVGYGRSNNSYGPLGYIHNGADDNASGVAGLLEIADALNNLPQAPRRSILLACWDGEEAGLLGSRHWIGRPTIPLSRVAITINMDMIGRMQNDRLEVLGSRTAQGLRRVVSQANDEATTTLDFTWSFKADSDHWPFYERRIPFLMFHTGLHGDYHRPSDDPQRINQAGLASVTRIAFQTLLQLADADKLPAFRDVVRSESSLGRYALEQSISPQPPRFGMPFKVEAAEPLKIVLTGFTAGSPAETSGLKSGDQLLEFNGRPIESETRFRLQLLAAAGETTFLVKRPGSDTPLLYKVTPRGEPIRVGLSWRFDDADPGVVLVTQVISSSAAQVAGLKLRDRIYSIGGNSFKSEAEFVALLTNVPSPMDLVVERDGKLQTLTLALLE